MAVKDRVRWDAYYRERRRQTFPKPDPFLLHWTPPASQGETQRALDLACGFGANGLWLAEQGYTVDLMDISRVALARARAETAMRNLRNVNLLQKDFDDFDLDEQVYDLVCMFRYLKRDMMRKVKASVTRGGRIIYETFNMGYLELVPEFNIDFLVGPGELRDMFDGWTVLHIADEDHISQVVAVNTPPPPDEEDDSFAW